MEKLKFDPKKKRIENFEEVIEELYKKEKNGLDAAFSELFPNRVKDEEFIKFSFVSGQLIIFFSTELIKLRELGFCDDYSVLESLIETCCEYVKPYTKRLRGGEMLQKKVEEELIKILSDETELETWINPKELSRIVDEKVEEQRNQRKIVTDSRVLTELFYKINKRSLLKVNPDIEDDFMKAHIASCVLRGLFCINMNSVYFFDKLKDKDVVVKDRVEFYTNILKNYTKNLKQEEALLNNFKKCLEKEAKVYKRVELPPPEYFI